jgi:hypothetical protein
MVGLPLATDQFANMGRAKVSDVTVKIMGQAKVSDVTIMAPGVYLSVAPSPPSFLFGVVNQFCRFGIWSNTLCITSVYALHTTRSPPPFPRYTLYKYIPLYLFTQGRRKGGR